MPLPTAAVVAELVIRDCKQQSVIVNVASWQEQFKSKEEMTFCREKLIPIVYKYNLLGWGGIIHQSKLTRGSW